jgi:type VI secretion system protein ImpE
MTTTEAAPPTSAGALFHEGRLADALAAATAAVRKAPGEAGPRVLLAELLLFSGDLVRADAVLDAAGAVDPGAALVIAEFRQLLRAATLRGQVLGEGRPPEFLGEPTASQRHLVEALVALREGDEAAAAAATTAAEAVRPPAPGWSHEDGETRPFADFRDACDLWGGTMEVLTVTGRYFWVPVERISGAVFHPIKRLRDLVWRRCTMDVRDGPDGDVYVPMFYVVPPDASDAVRLGRATEWSDTAPVRGSGQRLFLVGEDGVPAQQLTELGFS